MANPRFSQASLDFLTKAHRQKKKEWLEKNQAEYEDLITVPMKYLMDTVGQALRPFAPGYRFPTRNVARIKRSADNAKEYGPFRDWVHVSISKDSESRYDSLPNLFFQFAEGHEEILSAGGLYVPSADQTKHIRSWIDKDPGLLEDLLADKEFKKIYKGLGDERKLKTKPRDYPLEHPRFEMLRLSAWYVWRPFTKKQFFSKDFSKYLIEDWKQVLRLNKVLDTWTSVWPKTNAIEALPEARTFQDDWED